MTKIPIEVSARHIHLSKKDLEKLFGKRYKLSKLKDISQPGEFAAKETVDIEAGSKKILNVRIIGPGREAKTQLELSKTDGIILGMALPVRDSGNTKNSPGVVVSGPKNKIVIKEGVINTWRHIHCSFKKARKFGLEDKNLVSVKTLGNLSVTFHNVRVRLGKNYKFCLHLDTDEGNAAGIVRNGEGRIIS
ncbi:MAG: phosphate propanoyltransferase [bacterium]